VSEVLIKLRGVTNAFGANVVHENLDLDILRGEIIGLIGGSGSGKSVLLKSIVGLIRPTAGTIEVAGQNALSVDPAEREKLERSWGVTFQDGALFSSLTVLENVMVPIKEHQRDVPPEFAERLARLKIALAALPAEAGAKYPSELSGGMRKRAAVARALALDPQILFFDEPTAGLDPISAAEFDQLVLTLSRSLGLTVVVITHDLDTLYTICDRVAVLGNKHILTAGPLSEVEHNDDPWIQRYFQGPRGRAAADAHVKSQAASTAPARQG
jgi:phospholipid/cholesterol/gamma-HCH transport system ATP-binding protein